MNLRFQIMTEAVANLGVPVPVDVAQIEQELTSLWKSASEREGEGAVMRACSCNLVAIALDEKEAVSLASVLAKVSEFHPCRSIIAYREENGGNPVGVEAGMRAWLSAQCFAPVAGGPQVCCEAIAIAARGKAAGDLPNTLVSLLVPDLPAFVYWRSFRSPDQELVNRIAQFSDLLIVDSHASKEDLENRERLLELLRNPPAGISIRDLNWSRLTAWRDLIAQFFDVPSNRRHVWEISEIEICRAVARPGNVPTRTLLLIGWLAARLNWKQVSAERNGDEWLSRWQSASGDVVVRLTGSSAGAAQTADIQSVRLRTRSGVTFSVTQEKGSSCMSATSHTPASVLVHTVPRDSMDEATLLIRELSIAGEDAGFQAALAAGLELEKSFR